MKKKLFTLALLFTACLINAHSCPDKQYPQLKDLGIYDLCGKSQNHLQHDSDIIQISNSNTDDNIYVDGFYYHRLNDYEVEVTGSKQKEGAITIPDKIIYDFVFFYDVVAIGHDAFHGCSGLTAIEIPNSVTSIREGAFSWCTSLTSINIPNSVKSIGRSAFFGCSGLTSINIPNGVMSIEENTFSNCSGLESVTIPSSVTSIGNRAFDECTGLTSITISSGVTIIGVGAFHSCSGLTSINIPNSVTIIEFGAFSDCSGLTSINIPNSVIIIRANVFKNCNNLGNVTNLSRTPQIISSDVFEIYGTLHVLPGCGEAYRAAEVWKNFTIVEDATDGIGDILNDNKEPFIIGIYDLSGKKHNQLQPGTNIIRMEDGTMRKIIRK